LWISPGGAAHRAGIKVGDKVSILPSFHEQLLLEKFTKVQKDTDFWDLYARKMLVKSTLGIDFINILRVTFKSVFA